MALFKRNVKPGAAPPAADLQPPDDFAQRGAAAMAAGDLSRAVENYGNAIDKLHTMYVMGDCSYRQPSSSDYGILEGFVKAVKAVQERQGDAAVGAAVQQASSYLTQIADKASQVGAHPSTYLAYVDELSRI